MDSSYLNTKSGVGTETGGEQSCDGDVGMGTITKRLLLYQSSPSDQYEIVRSLLLVTVFEIGRSSGWKVRVAGTGCNSISPLVPSLQGMCVLKSK